jgi:mannose-6-phosphate isomerase
MLPLLKFAPVLLSKPWGGDALWRALRKGHANDDHMGESWELSDRPEGLTLVADGPLAGLSLARILERHGVEVLGDAPGVSVDQKVFPLLYKFIAAREKLSVQVHPGADSPLGEAKTECWYVVDAAPDAALIVGVNPGSRSREETLALLKSPSCESVLKRLPARVGDVFFIPAGTVHAITEGLLLYELQQNSDTTFRLYDWGRVDAAGNPRALHIEQATQVADTVARQGYRIPPLRITHVSHVEDYLVACKYFALTKWSDFKEPSQLPSRGRFQVVSVVAGHALLRGADGSEVSLTLGETAIIPACQNNVTLTASPDAQVLVSFVPDLEHDVGVPLRAAGFSPAAIAALSGPAGVAI